MEKDFFDFSTVVFYGQVKTEHSKPPRKIVGKNRLQNLVRHKSGRYYARALATTKRFGKVCETAHFSVAKARLAEFLSEQRNKKVTGGLTTHQRK